jgi:hypothetical protein
LDADFTANDFEPYLKEADFLPLRTRLFSICTFMEHHPPFSPHLLVLCHQKPPLVALSSKIWCSVEWINVEIAPLRKAMLIGRFGRPVRAHIRHQLAKGSET